MNRKKSPALIILRFATWFSAFVTAALLFYIVVFVLLKGLPYIKPQLFSPRYTSENVSLLPALISTFLMTALSLFIAVPLGVCSAIWLSEYAKSGSRLVAFVRMAAETLSGIPSIVYGLFGMLFFVIYLDWGFSLLAGAFTLSMMILPLVMRSAEEALRSVPAVWREGAYGLGAGKLRTVFRIALPAAAPGILAGVILAIGRIVGETAALIYTAGTAAQIPRNPLESARTLSVHMYALSSEGLHTGEAYASAAVLLFVVLAINAAAAWAAKAVAGNGKR